MKSNFTPVIGIEVHTALNTKSKMFTAAKNTHNARPNTNICPLDLGMPGLLPTVNEEAVKKGIILAYALDMDIDLNLRFDRKNYYYQDLPKGYQITQQFHPIGKNGEIKLDNGKTIGIERIHLEEDTAKEIIINDHILLDYNRSGVPLIEIVSRPDIANGQEAVEYLTKLKRILVFMGISDGKMEDGSLRADVNISVMPTGSSKFGTKVEIKNLNSFAAVAKAIDYEIDRQCKELLAGKNVVQETRKWDDAANKTAFMRSKTDTFQYYYFREPNINPIQLSEEFKSQTLANTPALPEAIAIDLRELNVNEKIINQLLDDYHLYKVFAAVYEATKNVELTITWVVVELLSYLKANNLSIENVTDQQIKLIGEMIKLLIAQDLNGKQAKIVFPIMLKESIDPEVVMEEQHLVQIKDPNVLRKYLIKIVDDNIKMLEQYETRGERVLKFYLGMLMKETHGQANPNVANEVLLEIIKEKLKK
ncbi:MAG: Asp-tRNA(Asn)/Glu-tRNA(Gln) amidotransferase subunit GatB [Malacoplasma sp.]|nr:Asp-tRNA(Asn)/Glu-tRNA(Gln) amidotransferase subunit GatB [Malacoplasma sp.]